MLMVALLAFTITSGVDFWLHENYTIMKKEYEGIYLDSNFTFSQADGFAVAASVWIGHNNGLGEDPEIGEVKFYIKSW